QSIGDDRQAHHERHEPHVVPEIAHRGAEPPEAGIAASAVIAGDVVDADEVAARGADDRSGPLPLEHPPENSTRTFRLTGRPAGRLIPQMPPDDAAAIARAKGGDEDAFRVLVERHGRTIYRLAFRMTGRAEDAEDVVQETFVRAYRQLGRFEARSQ